VVDVKWSSVLLCKVNELNRFKGNCHNGK
jgi:hypothetical protein